MLNAFSYLMAPQERMRDLSLIFSMAGPVAATDREGMLVAVNGAFLGLLGFKEEELLGMRFDNLLADMDAGLTGFMAREGAVRGLETALVKKRGGSVPVSVSASALADASGAPDGFIISAMDLSAKAALMDELVRVRGELAKRVSYIEDFREGVFQMLKEIDLSEKELEGAYRRLKETQAQLIHSGKMTALGELAAGLAHELNQPLTVIKGLSQILLKEAGEGSARHEKLKLMIEASRKMELVIKHLKVFSRTDEPSFKPIDINAVIKDSLILFREIFLKSSVRIVLNLPPVPKVLGSASRLEQVIINLANNARDAMEGGGEITISTEELKSNGLSFVRVTVEDTGHGIPDDIIGRIFDPFFTTKAAGKGTGLGLSISYGIVKEHKGDITAHSVPGKGASFQITLPAYAPAMHEMTGQPVSP